MNIVGIATTIKRGENYMGNLTINVMITVMLKTYMCSSEKYMKFKYHLLLENCKL